MQLPRHLLGPGPQARSLGPGPRSRCTTISCAALFRAKAANELWFADITEHPTAEGKLYLCAIKDAFSGRIVGYSMDSHMKASLAVTALHIAIALRGPVGTIVHSDRGSQFRSGKFLRALRSAGLIGSMGRTGTCADNAAMESFFALVQNNVFDRQRWQTREELRLAVVVWIERTYHRRRRQRAPRQAHPDRVRSRSRGCLCSVNTVNPASQPKWGQSPATSSWSTLAECGVG